jgi:hypothetical protein
MGNIFLAAIAFAIYSIWKLKGILFVLMLVLLAGCNAVEETCYYDAWGDHYCTKTYYFDSTPQPSTVYVVEEKEPEDTLIYIENSSDYYYTSDMSVFDWSYQCGDLAYFTSPYNHDPRYCYHYDDHHVECDWHFGGGCFETWLWDDWNCEWVYLFDYCEKG